jgi:hypothetical protein
MHMDISVIPIDAVRALERELALFPQVDLSTTHLVHGGMYARTIFIPAGVALTGALTEMDNICVLYGDITVTTDEGPRRLTGFHVLPAKAGAKRAGVTHAETWWTTIIPTELTDISAIEEAMTTEADRLQSRNPALGNVTHGALT